MAPEKLLIFVEISCTKPRIANYTCYLKMGVRFANA